MENDKRLYYWMGTASKITMPEVSDALLAVKVRGDNSDKVARAAHDRILCLGSEKVHLKNEVRRLQQQVQILESQIPRRMR